MNKQKKVICRCFAAACGMALSLTAASVLAEEDLTELDDVVVTGTKTEKKLTDVPVRTELIKRAAIEEMAARTLADAVEFTSGVRVENNCQNCNFSQLRLLGLEGPYSQILMDGQPLMSSVASVYGVEHIPARMIDRIEIVKGGGSALYGPGAVAGIINVISRDPVKSGGDIDITYENMDGADSRSVSGTGDLVSDDGKTRISVRAQADNREGYDRDGDGFTEMGERDMRSVGMRLRQFIADNADVKAEYTYMWEDRRGGDRLDLPVTQAEVAEAVETTRHLGSLSWSHSPVETFDYRLTGSFVLTERDTYYGSGMDPNAFGTSENPLYVLDSQFNHYLGEHTLTWGVQYQVEELEDRQPAYDRMTDETYTDIGVFVQDDWAVSDTLSLVLGGRVDKHSEIDSAIVSPRLALKWTPAPSFSVRSSYASGFRAPQVFDEDLHITQVGGEGQIIRNDPDLKEERSDSMTVGFEWTPQAGIGVALLEANAFYTRLTDAFSLEQQDDPSTEELEFARINRGEAQVYGLELNTGYRIGEAFEARLGWVFQQSEFEDADEDFGSTDFFRTPDSYGVMTLAWRNPRFVNLFIGATYTGAMKVPHYAGYIDEDRLETSKTFLTWDASLSRSFSVGNSDLTLTLGCKNITDEYQEDLDQGADRDAGYVYGPRFPRTVYASAKVAF